ncbi:MAG: type II toxin-antitoxin system RelE/ParE family toxin [Paraburkholderia sp.]|nr:MAG: type II toxin-antitoxin system RelE/ParE family toxin [Paraburkholderia sp.]
MKSKPVIPREIVRQDINEAISYDLEEGAAQAALGFIDALEQAHSHLARHPDMGSPRYSYELDIPGLRSWPLKRYPHLIFYVNRTDHVDVWRVIDGSRDIPAWLRDEE